MRNEHIDRYLVFLICCAGLAAKLIYVFYFTDYTNYIHSDAAGYWERALHRYHDKPTTMTQWWVWPPLSHIILSWYFEVLDLIGLAQYKLKASLAMNCIASSLALYCFYFTSRNIGLSKLWAIIGLLILSAIFPLYYLNSFILSEVPALLFLSMAFFFLTIPKANKKHLFVGGLLLALASGFKPSLGTMGLAFGLYILFGFSTYKNNIQKAFSFSCGFIIAISLIMAENYRISDGELRSIGAAAGINYFMKQCKIHKLEYQAPGLYYNFVPAMTADKPHFGNFVGQKPFHKQSYYFSLGDSCVAANSNANYENAVSLLSLFFGPFYPSFPSAEGFNELLPGYRIVLAGICISSFMLFALLLFTRHRRNSMLLMGSICCVSTVYYFLNVDHRHLYSLLWPVLLLLLLGLQHLISCRRLSSITCALFIVSASPILAAYIQSVVYPNLRDNKRPLEFDLDDIPPLPHQGAFWNTAGFYKLFSNGIHISTPTDSLKNKTAIVVSLDNNDSYRLEFIADGDSLFVTELGPQFRQLGGLNHYSVALNETVKTQGSDKIIITPLNGDQSYSFGGLQIIE